MISIGLDLSINSTGVCIYNSETNKTQYYIIGSKFTKKSLSCDISNVKLIQYDKEVPSKDSEYHIKERAKTINIYNIVKHIEYIVLKYQPDVCTIEGVSFQSNGSIVDLSGLNYMIRSMLIRNKIDTYIVSPTQNKKFATGNGQAEKDVMISAWKHMDTTSISIPEYIKVDDIADAYFLARYGMSLSVK